MVSLASNVIKFKYCNLSSYSKFLNVGTILVALLDFFIC